MEWLLALVAGGSGIGAIRYAVLRRRSRHDARTELAAVRRLADEDVVIFGEQLQRLGDQVAVSDLDVEGRVDYQRALDAYESAQRTVHHLRDPDEVSQVTDTLSTGRYALACVQARVAGRGLPELRTPCFFNPQHGPSTTDVEWTTGRHGTRRVPACSQDAARVAAHETPQVRMAAIGNRRVPYWEAGAAYQPYARGYFPAGLTTGTRIDWAFGMGGLGGDAVWNSWLPAGGADVGSVGGDLGGFDLGGGVGGDGGG